MAKGINLKAFQEFLRSEQIGGVILICCVLISLLIANSPAGEAFQHLLDSQVGFRSQSLSLQYSISFWINDGLMAIFFLLVGLEIKREIVEGELSTPEKAVMPILAALGGMLFPAAIFALFNFHSPTISGWGIPMATDIAFALCVISLLGNRVPPSLKIFLAALAIADDLGAIFVIAIFYTQKLHWDQLAYAAGILALLILMNRAGVKNIVLYILPGLILWYFIHHSGIHATISGVLLALTIPTNQTDETSPLEKLEHLLARPVNFVIMPVFALANTNIRFQSSMVEGLTSPLGLGIIFGLMLGKPFGVTLLSWLSVKLGLAVLPTASNWKHIVGIGLLAGIGFTMSIFIALLSFTDLGHQVQSKFAILIASICSGILGFAFLKRLNKAE